MDCGDPPIIKKSRLLDSLETEKPVEAIGKEQKSDVFRKFPKKHSPKFRLKGNGENAVISLDAIERVPLMLTDIQQLLLHCVLGNAVVEPQSRWYVLERCGKIKNISIVVLEGISSQDWMRNKDKLNFTVSLLPDIVEIVTPSIYGGSLVENLALVPLSEVEKENLIETYGNMVLALENRKDLMPMIKAVFPIENDLDKNTDLLHKDKYPRTKLLLSARQLIQENFPLPLTGKMAYIYSHYVLTKDQYQPVTSKSPMFGLDCEMCMTSIGSEVTRVSIVTETYEVLYETYVKPHNEIIDYLTHFSGITHSLLKDVTKRLDEVQNDIRELIPPDAILVGQSINIDLHALKMMHPYIIDTSVIFNFTGERYRKPKLKTLAREHLKENIQDSTKGHCSIEDSITALKLVQLKLSKSIDFGDAVLSSYKKNDANNVQYVSSIFNHLNKQKRKTLIVGSENIVSHYSSYLKKTNEGSNNECVIKRSKYKRIKLSTVNNCEEMISNVVTYSNHYDCCIGHMKLEITDDNKESELIRINNWLNDVWKALDSTAFFVVILGGTYLENGMAMLSLKK